MRKQTSMGEVGFTLIEMMVTLGVLAILVVLAVPSFNDFVRGQRVKTASFDVFAAMTYARSEALKRNTDVTVTPVAGDWSKGWTVVAGTTTLRQQQAYPDSVAISGPTNITYRRDGRASSAGNVQVTPNPASAGIAPRCISVDLSGRPNSKQGACS